MAGSSSVVISIGNARYGRRFGSLPLSTKTIAGKHVTDDGGAVPDKLKDILDPSNHASSTCAGSTVSSRRRIRVTRLTSIRAQTNSP